MSVIVPVLIVVATFLVMEWVAWASHKYVMHGFGWAWHRDHHEPHDNMLEKNDRFALFGAALTFIGLIHGEKVEWNANGQVALGYLFAAVVIWVVAYKEGGVGASDLMKAVTTPPTEEERAA